MYPNLYSNSRNQPNSQLTDFQLAIPIIDTIIKLYAIRCHKLVFYGYIMNLTDNLIFFEEEEYSNAKRIHSLELMVETLSTRLTVALNEISSLKQQLYDHINCQHDNEPQSRFRITHVPKTHSSDDSSSGETLLIDV